MTVAGSTHDVFVTEAPEILDALTAGLLALDRGDPTAPVIGELFRRAHTLKGAARVVRVPAGSWAAYRDCKVRENRGRIEQYKHVYLVQDLDFASALSEKVGHPINGVEAPSTRS